ncbi:MAG: RNA polymerase sigma factor [Planctomycetota bacterium]
MAASVPPEAPHLEPSSWGRLIDSIDAANVFVLIAGWLGPRARIAVSVEDLWQETLWMAWRDRRQHEWVNLTKYRAWLLGIARNRVHEFVRNAGRQKRGGGSGIHLLSAYGGADTAAGYLPPQSTTPSRVASNLERARILERALGALDESLRDIVRLRLFEEVPMREAAARLGVPLSTAKERFVRGTQRYRGELSRLLGERDSSTEES